jgi:heptosyltransferase I
VYDECVEKQKGKPWDALPWGARAKGSQLMEKITVDMVKQKVAPFLA